MRSRVGDTRAAALEEEAGTEGCDFGDGRACDDRWRAGEDKDAPLSDGAV